METTMRWGRGQAAKFGWAAILATVSAMLLVACGGDEAATSLPATARTAATAVVGTAPPNTVATAVAMATAAAGATRTIAGPSGPQATITGEVTRFDPAARTFTVRGTDGKDYDFSASADKQIDLAVLAAHLASRQQITVTYRGVALPYEVLGVR
jgi:hypothetical protein